MSKNFKIALVIFIAWAAIGLKHAGGRIDLTEWIVSLAPLFILLSYKFITSDKNTDN